MKNLNEYRRGAVGALMDEYERAAREFQAILQTVDDEDFARIADSETEDEACRSIQTIASHVIAAGYFYANYFRDAFSMASEPVNQKSYSRGEAVAGINSMLEYTIETLDGRWEMSDDEVVGTVIKTRWGGTYDLEQLLEHAIVHVLRHRRQIEKFILKFDN